MVVVSDRRAAELIDLVGAGFADESAKVVARRRDSGTGAQVPPRILSGCVVLLHVEGVVCGGCCRLFLVVLDDVVACDRGRRRLYGTIQV